MPDNDLPEDFFYRTDKQRADRTKTFRQSRARGPSADVVSEMHSLNTMYLSEANSSVFYENFDESRDFLAQQVREFVKYRNLDLDQSMRNEWSHGSSGELSHGSSVFLDEDVVSFNYVNELLTEEIDSATIDRVTRIYKR